jgi:hypothetical protein
MGRYIFQLAAPSTPGQYKVILQFAGCLDSSHSGKGLYISKRALPFLIAKKKIFRSVSKLTLLSFYDITLTGHNSSYSVDAYYKEKTYR